MTYKIQQIRIIIFETTRPDHGFTLIELITVIAVLSILMAGTGLTFMHHLPDYRLSKATQELFLDFHLAKSLAVLNTETVEIRFDTANGSYAIFALGSDGEPGGTGAAQDRIIKQVRLGDFKGGIRFGKGSAQTNIPGNPFNGTFVSYTNNCARFIASGMVNTKGYVYLTNTKNALCYGVGTPTLSGVLVKKKTVNGAWIDG